MNSEFSILSTAILLMFILDPFGNVPMLLAILKDVDEKRKKIIIIRESLFGLVILLMFLFFGESFLNIFHLETAAVTIAGGVIFFIIALKMIFPGEKGNASLFGTDAPFIVPIAIPMIAGPSALGALFLSLMIAWSVSFIVLYSSPLLYKALKSKGLSALEKLMGMLLLMLSVQMFVDGIRELISTT